jgi:HK97 family phage prohead protease
MDIIKRELIINKSGYAQDTDDVHEYNANSDIYTFTISTPEIDRYGTIIIPSGIDYSAYLNNPVVLAQHDSDDLPIGKCLGFAMNGENLEATIQVHRLTKDACEIADLLNAGYLNAVSVGIIPVTYHDETINGEKVTVYDTSELVEFSVVTIPANRGALIKKSTNIHDEKSRLKTILQKLKKVIKMLTPEQTQAISEQLLPVLTEAVMVFLTEQLAIAEDEATIASENAVLALNDSLLATLNGEAPEVAPEVVTPDASQTVAPAEPSTASLDVRAGKKISATSSQMILEGLQMINEGQGKIKKVLQSQRSIDVPKKLSTDDLLNLI